MGAQGGTQTGRQNRHPILGPLTVANHDLASLKIDIFHAQAQALHQPQPGPIDQARHQGARALHGREQAFDFMHTKHCRQACGALGPHHLVQPRKFSTEHLPIEEQQGRQGLLLRCRRDIVLDGQIGEESRHLAMPHLRRMP